MSKVPLLFRPCLAVHLLHCFTLYSVLFIKCCLNIDIRMCKLMKIASWRESSQIATNRMSISDSQYQRWAQGLDKVGHGPPQFL